MSERTDDWAEHDARGPGARLDGVLRMGRGEDHEHDDSLANDVLQPDVPEDDPRPRRRRRSPVPKIVALVVAAALVLAAGYYSFQALRPLLPEFAIGSDAPQDYEGSGEGEVIVDIPPGAGGGQIAEILTAEDVVASTSAFTAALQAEPRASSIQPGTYEMAQQMSSQSALERLLDGTYRQSTGVTVREGLWVDETFALLAEATEYEVEDYQAVDPESLDLPAAANGDLEGYLYPSTYEFATDATPEEQLRIMVEQGEQVYANLEIPADELGDVITKASLVQSEGAFADDLPRVARVIENRLEEEEALRFDSTVHFIYQERGRAGTTNEQRSNDSPYNTYVHEGLPPGPISSPGEAAIRAVLDPTPGPWLFFVTVNPSTGETNFAETYEEHLENQEIFLEWCEENPDQC